MYKVACLHPLVPSASVRHIGRKSAGPHGGKGSRNAPVDKITGTEPIEALIKALDVLHYPIHKVSSQVGRMDRGIGHIAKPAW